MRPPPDRMKHFINNNNNNNNVIYAKPRITIRIPPRLCGFLYIIIIYDDDIAYCYYYHYHLSVTSVHNCLVRDGNGCAGARYTCDYCVYGSFECDTRYTEKITAETQHLLFRYVITILLYVLFFFFLRDEHFVDGRRGYVRLGVLSRGRSFSKRVLYLQ